MVSKDVQGGGEVGPAPLHKQVLNGKITKKNEGWGEVNLYNRDSHTILPRHKKKSKIKIMLLYKCLNPTPK